MTKIKEWAVLLLRLWRKYYIFFLYCVFVSGTLLAFYHSVHYGLMCILTFLLIFLVILCREFPLFSRGVNVAAKLRDVCIILLSAFHGAYVLGMLSYGAYYPYSYDYVLPRLLNLFAVIAIYWLFFLLTGKVTGSVGGGNLFIGLLGTVNYYLQRFRGEPFLLSRLSGLATAKNVISEYSFAPDRVMLQYLLDLLIWWLLLRLTGELHQRKNRRSPFSFALSSGMLVLLAVVSLPSVRNRAVQDFSTDWKSGDSGAYFINFYIDATAAPLTEGYSLEVVDAAIEAIREDQRNTSSPVSVNAPAQKPNIVVIMNESFSDLRVLGELETNLPCYTFLDSLQDNVIRGYLNTSVWGGSTCMPEYEALSGDIYSSFCNDFPFNTFFHGAGSTRSFPGLVSILEQQGYSTVALHPFSSTGWNRPTAYRSIGFDEMFFMEDLPKDMELSHGYISDRADYAFVMELFKSKEAGKPLFLFNVTIQNHGGYLDEDFENSVQLLGEQQGLYPQTEQYLTLIRMSDMAIGNLLGYFEDYPEPVIVLFFGDHHARLEEDFYQHLTGTPRSQWTPDQLLQLYKTPMFLWRNYESESKWIGDISANYLPGLLLQESGLEMSEYLQYTLDMYARYPVITFNGVVDADGTLYSPHTELFSDIISTYRLLSINHIVDWDTRRDDFFSLPEK